MKAAKLSASFVMSRRSCHSTRGLEPSLRRLLVSKYQTSPRWSPRMHRQTRAPPSSLPIKQQLGRQVGADRRVALGELASVVGIVQAEE
jgi:hypothetical protein